MIGRPTAAAKTVTLSVAVLLLALHPGLHQSASRRTAQPQLAQHVVATGVPNEVRADRPPHPRPVVASRTRVLVASKRATHKRHAIRITHYDSAAEAWAHTPKAIGVANCESGPGHRAPKYDVYVGDIRQRFGSYTGKWQFAVGTWRSVGGTGMPYAASESEQDYRAWLLWKRDGWSPWECAHQV